MNANFDLNLFNQYGSTIDTPARARQSAAARFDRVYSQARRSLLISRLSGRNGGLRMLKHAPAGRNSRSAGIVNVALDRIVGSEDRSGDFDAEFRPLKLHNQERWIGIDVARRMGVALPPVELVQDGEHYYVRDGHHRISVAKAMGQLEIEARIVN